MSTRRILMTGGGSGGHVYPLLAVAEVLRSLDTGQTIELHYMGPADAYQPLFTQLDVNVHVTSGAKLRRYFSVQNILDVPRFFLSILQALWRVFWLMPDATYSKGGPGALPVVIASWFFRVPVVVHESDVVPGLTNRISAHFAKRIAVSFEVAGRAFKASKVAWTGHPERRSIREVGLSRDNAKMRLGFIADEPLVVVIGGSQGSVRLNEALLGALPSLVQVTQVLHQTGPGNDADAKAVAEAGMVGVDGMVAARHPWKVTPYLVDIGAALTAADIVVSRAGSGSIFEIASFGRAAVLVPLPESANDHQRLNAVTFAAGGGAIVIEEANLVPGIVARQVADLLADAPRRQGMEGASRAFAKDGAADLIAAELLRL